MEDEGDEPASAGDDERRKVTTVTNRKVSVGGRGRDDERQSH
jgi:hypothetical protein